MKKIILIIMLVILSISGCSSKTFSPYGVWDTSNKNLLVFNKDNSFALYTNNEVLDKNYSTGTFSIKNSDAALEELSLTKDDLKDRNWESKNLYSIKLFLEKSNVSGETMLYENSAFIHIMIYYSQKENKVNYYDLTNAYSGYLTPSEKSPLEN